ncbi:MAG: gamma carbonic anhydrase family protein [Chloroflexi bacterium]|nr:gamma carbonic anhydrase family protein [Chloroflexota bacterium]
MKTRHTAFQPHKVHPSAFIARGAVIVGDVTLGANASVWFNAVLRGDSESLRIGAGSNIQDGAVCHADPGLPLVIGAGVTVGHRAIVHGAHIGEHSLIGMGAIVMNGARIGASCLVGAGALVTEGKEFPARSLILGSPARLVRGVTDEEIAMMRRTAAEYVEKARAFREAKR